MGRFSRRQIGDIFLIFPSKLDMKLHKNWRQFCMKCCKQVSRKNKKNITNLSSAEIFPSMQSLKEISCTQETIALILTPMLTATLTLTLTGSTPKICPCQPHPPTIPTSLPWGHNNSRNCLRHTKCHVTPWLFPPGYPNPTCKPLHTPHTPSREKVIQRFCINTFHKIENIDHKQYLTEYLDDQTKWTAVTILLTVMLRLVMQHGVQQEMSADSISCLELGSYS